MGAGKGGVRGLGEKGKPAILRDCREIRLVEVWCVCVGVGTGGAWRLSMRSMGSPFLCFENFGYTYLATVSYKHCSPLVSLGQEQREQSGGQHGWVERRGKGHRWY